MSRGLDAMIEGDAGEQEGRLRPHPFEHELAVGHLLLLPRRGGNCPGRRFDLGWREDLLRQAEVVQDQEPQEAEPAGRTREAEELAAGLTAAIYATRAALRTLVISGTTAGGQLMITTDVENYPGFPSGVQGPELMELWRKQAERFKAEFVDDNVSRVEFGKPPFRVWTSDGTHQGHSVIIATGANAKYLGLPNEERLKGHGVSACATCDGFFFKTLDVVVVGGGDTAMEESLYLSKLCKTVTVVHRRDTFRASKIMQERLFKTPNVKVIWNSEVVDVFGE